MLAFLRSLDPTLWLEALWVREDARVHMNEVAAHADWCLQSREMCKPKTYSYQNKEVIVYVHLME